MKLRPSLTSGHVVIATLYPMLITGIVVATMITARMREKWAATQIEEIGRLSGAPVSFVISSDQDALDRLFGIDGRITRMEFGNLGSEKSVLKPRQVHLLSVLPHLESLVLKNVVLDELLKSKLAFPNGLKYVWLESISGDKSAAAVALAFRAQDALKHVYIMDCDSIDDSFLKAISASRELVDVTIENTSITGTGFASFAGHPDLDIDMEGCPLTTAGIKALSSIPLMRTLSLRAGKESREALCKLTSLPITCHLLLQLDGFSIQPSLQRQLSERCASFDCFVLEK